MNSKVILIIIGVMFLLPGILLLVAASQYDWEVKEYKKLFGKDAPQNIQKTTNIIGVLLVVLGLIFIGWGLAIHTKMVPKLKN